MPVLTPGYVNSSLMEFRAKQMFLDNISLRDGIVALAGGGQTGATALVNMYNRVTTVATAADSVMLPSAIPGSVLVVVNAAAANSMNVFPVVGDAINALAVNTAFAVAANKTVEFYCIGLGVWNSLVTA